MSEPWPGQGRAAWTVSVAAPDRDGERPPAVGASVAGLATLDERALVEACLEGRPDAFDVLVARHQQAVYRLCYRFLGNPEDATDLAQEVFLRAYRALGSFKGQASLGTWLYRIGVNLCLNKKSSKAPIPESLDERRLLPAGGPDAMGQLLTEERAAGVRAAIARLPDRQRATLILRVYQELPHREIAQILGTSEGAVKANFFHALKNLRRLLGGGTR